MALVNSFDQWQKISVPSNSYLSLKQLNDGQCQWELIEKTHAKPAIKDWQNLPANEFNHLQTKRLYQSLTSLIEDSKTRRWFVGEHPWWDWSFNLQFIEDLTPDDPLNRWIEEMADKLGNLQLHLVHPLNSDQIATSKIRLFHTILNYQANRFARS